VGWLLLVFEMLKVPALRVCRRGLGWNRLLVDHITNRGIALLPFQEIGMARNSVSRRASSNPSPM
jgi:hypothetical protein